MTRNLFCYLLLMIFIITRAQQPPNEKQVTLWNKLKVAARDTSRVNVLLELCQFHWNNKRNNDSLLSYANSALDLSRTLQFGRGIGDAAFYIGRVYLRKKQVYISPKHCRVKHSAAMELEYLRLLTINGLARWV